MATKEKLEEIQEKIIKKYLDDMGWSAEVTIDAANAVANLQRVIITLETGY